MESMVNRSMVMPKPAKVPVAKIVSGKNLRPMTAVLRPNTMKRGPRIAGLLMKNLLNLLAEKTGHALACLMVTEGEHTSYDVARPSSYQEVVVF